MLQSVLDLLGFGVDWRVEVRLFVIKTESLGADTAPHLAFLVVGHGRKVIYDIILVLFI
jgi:hypothetical protein